MRIDPNGPATRKKLRFPAKVLVVLAALGPIAAAAEPCPNIGLSHDLAEAGATTKSGGDTDPAPFGLRVQIYAPTGDQIGFKWPTHIAFGPDREEIVTDLKNNRFVHRDHPDAAWQVSPLSVRGPHSVAHNAADGLYYANDTENHRMIAFADPSAETVAAETGKIAGIELVRPHDVVIDPGTGWIYALNPNSGQVFRFTAIGENESAIRVPVGGYARSLALVKGKLYVIGSAKGRVVRIVDWDAPTFRVYDSLDPSGRDGSAGSWKRTGLVLNDVEYFEGHWYATSYFSEPHAAGTDPNENKFIRFAELDDLAAGDWTDLSSLVPDGMTPYYLTRHGDTLNLAIFNHGSPGKGDSILRFTTTPASTR